MPEIKPYLAYSATGWVYRFEQRSDRAPRRVIRIINRHEISKSSANVAANMPILFADNTNAGKDWSAEELNLYLCNVEAGTELAVVVGEAFEAKQRVPPATSRAQLDETYHILKDTQPTISVVQKLSGTPGVLYGLYNKKDGLCDTLPLPKDVWDRVVFYPEWTEFVNHNDARQYYKDWKTKARLHLVEEARKFSQNSLKRRRLRTDVDESEGPSKHGPLFPGLKPNITINAQLQNESLDEDMTSEISSLKTPSIDESLMDSQPSHQIPSITLNERAESPSSHQQHAHLQPFPEEWRLVETLVYGDRPVSATEAKAMAQACETLFGRTASILQPFLLHETQMHALATGLRDGKLEGQCRPAKQDLKPFILAFCYSCSDKKLMFEYKYNANELGQIEYMIKTSLERATDSSVRKTVNRDRDSTYGSVASGTNRDTPVIIPD
ncbi:hypothetical protein F5Y16DRAFT_415379 [Xylariaceae sp. FL0255]|nr:hypothetical protein F5Y16DRAFT_415379 [Xylariaceae sp. FL0255]